MRQNEEVKKKGCLIGFASVVGILLVVVFLTPFGRGLRDILKSGIFVEAKQERLSATVDDQLKMMFAAAMTHHQSEEKFPEASTWMDDLLKRMQTQNLLPGEAEKKMIRSDLVGQPGKFGFALNSAVVGKYKGDLKDESIILIFTSKIDSKNATGEPKSDGLPGGKGITLKGDVVNLP